MSPPNVIEEKIRFAASQLALAEQELTDVMRALQDAPRANKTHVGEVIERAFEKLRAARKTLVDVEAAVSGALPPAAD